MLGMLKINGLTKEDLVIAISFGRCLRETVESVLRVATTAPRSSLVSDRAHPGRHPEPGSLPRF